MITTSSNQYFVCLGRGQQPIPWNPFDADQKVNLHTDYFGKAFVALEQKLEQDNPGQDKPDREGWIVYLTWDLDELPGYGDKVIAVVMGDEWGRMPHYADRVGALFKCYGTSSTPTCNPFRNPRYLNWLTAFKFLYSLTQYAPSWLRYRRAKYNSERLRGSMPPVYTIPLGYANQHDLPMVPLQRRPADISFAGSVQHKSLSWWSPKKWLGTPKSLSRKNMLTALTRIRASHPEWEVDLKITPSFNAARSASTAEYSRRVMNTKISVVPRGNSFETFRFFEALRAGCILITEHLPDAWFYHGAPVVRLNDWSELDEVLEDLMGDQEQLQRLHQQSLGW